MAIYLHPINEAEETVNQNDWVEIDLISWDSSDSDYPIRLTLLRRLDPNTKEPYLQELMFKNVYQNLPISQLRLEIPNKADKNTFDLYLLKEVKVINYRILPTHHNNKQSYEKILLAAKSQYNP